LGDRFGLKFVKIIPLIKSEKVSVSADAFVLLSLAYRLFIVDPNTGAITSKFLPSDFCAVDAIFANNQIIALSDKGELAFSRPDSGELTLD
jgi:hypothetical protein